MLKLCDSMSQNAKTEGRFHNPKVGGSIPPPATKHPLLELRLLHRHFLDSRFNAVLLNFFTLLVRKEQPQEADWQLHESG
jgi:hypothetical protein